MRTTAYDVVRLKTNAVAQIAIGSAAQTFFYTFGPASVVMETRKSAMYPVLENGWMLETTTMTDAAAVGMPDTNMMSVQASDTLCRATRPIWFQLSTPLEVTTVSAGIFIRDFDFSITFLPVATNDAAVIWRALAGFDCEWWSQKTYLSVIMSFTNGTKLHRAIPLHYTNEAKLEGAPQVVRYFGSNLVKIMNDARGPAESERLRTNIYNVVTMSNLSQGFFSVPADGEITSPYGIGRQYTKTRRSFHRGLDIGNSNGTPVRASGSGIVRLSELLYVRGNCIIIDHGLGLFSGYFHMSRLIATNGAFVSKGDVIGEIGATGLATGPHLHWEMSVGNVRVDPNYFTRNDIFSTAQPFTEIDR
ncbi:MAG: M23 family metallopeptidase [Spirochaetes bacterium]|nr:M23 family metallopeptidase [Spirochaetota bacterium]